MYIILYYAKVGSARVCPSEGSGGGSTLHNCKISMTGLVDHIELYYIIRYYVILYHAMVGSARSRERGVQGAATLGKLLNFNSGSCTLTILYCTILYYTKVGSARPSTGAGGLGGGTTL